MKPLKQILNKIKKMLRPNKAPAAYLDLPDAPDFISKEPKLTPYQNYLHSEIMAKHRAEEWRKNSPSTEWFTL